MNTEKITIEETQSYRREWPMVRYRDNTEPQIKEGKFQKNRCSIERLEGSYYMLQEEQCVGKQNVLY